MHHKILKKKKKNSDSSKRINKYRPESKIRVPKKISAVFIASGREKLTELKK